ncbi:MAG: 50S ribosomal protein L11 methyltransferase [Cyclobacteriaceae bacterium]|jgi:ribosomal protein L11 methyltransferase|nr:50S ribosomal protein L11 methyltransferase [Flammeovirgaceae bacterium]MCZ8021905.1 50S ribosomal protein L11 methyltransferase [Cytophagales bacterium]MCZ8329354.1 50S ribosomal protein L11 methyltransferase [Cyclobacteriaceae bacterium]
MYHTRLSITCATDYAEILMAEIAETGFDTFMETETGIEAYAEEDKFNKADLLSILERYQQQSTLSWHFDTIEKKNWNEEWEKNYEPVIVDDRCIIRAAFHQPEKKYTYDIIITPKMSFGTGHHATTHLMIKHQLDINHQNKLVMDAGCGTAVLSVMAAKHGASFVDAFDIDAWSIENGKENAEMNNCPNIRIRQGKISDLKFNEPFDIILANINKNILLMEMPYYSTYLKKDGLLLLSGFYEHDIADIENRAKGENLILQHIHTLETWAAVLCKKM